MQFHRRHGKGVKLVYESLKPQMEELWLPILSQLPSDNDGGDKEGKGEDGAFSRALMRSSRTAGANHCWKILPEVVGNEEEQISMENLEHNLLPLLAKMRSVNLLRVSRTIAQHVLESVFLTVPACLLLCTTGW